MLKEQCFAGLENKHGVTHAVEDDWRALTNPLQNSLCRTDKWWPILDRASVEWEAVRNYDSSPLW